MLTPAFFALLFSVMLAWLLYCLVCIGLGWPFYRMFRIANPQPADVMWIFWVGLGALLAILQIYQLFFPVDGWAFVIIVCLGLALFLKSLPDLLAAAAIVPRRQRAVFVIFTLAITFWIADRAANGGNFWDSGLYHIPAMEWVSQYRIVPGLANLHIRLGFTSTMPLLAALMNQGPLAGQANHLVNSFLLAGLTAMAVRGAIGIFRRDSAFRPDHWVMLFSISAVTEWAMDPQASSLSTDLAPMVLMFAAAASFLQIFSIGWNCSTQANSPSPSPGGAAGTSANMDESREKIGHHDEFPASADAPTHTSPSSPEIAQEKESADIILLAEPESPPHSFARSSISSAHSGATPDSPALPVSSPILDPSQLARKHFLIFACLTLCAMSISTKIAAATFAEPLGLVALWLTLRSPVSWPRRLGNFLAAASLWLVIVGVWMIRQVILTGYPLFPSPVLPFKVNWRFPRNDPAAPWDLEHLGHILLNWARTKTYDDTSKDFKWLGTWWHLRIMDPWDTWKGLVPFSIGVGCLIAFAILRYFRPALPRPWRAIWWVWIAAGISIAAWFKLAPEPRYCPQLILVCALGMGMAAGMCAAGSRRAWPRIALIVLALALGAGPIFNWLQYAWVMPGPKDGFQPMYIVGPPPKAVLLVPGVNLYVPADDQSGSRLWDAPLPNTPYINAKLKMRNPPFLQDGFKTE